MRTRRANIAAALLAAITGAVAVAGCGAEGERPPAERAPGGDASGRFTLVATGDVIPYPSIMGQARTDAGGSGYDFRQILSGVRPVVSAADLAICHHETVYGEKGGPYTGYPTFKSPHQLAAGLRATGYDMCSTASNHTLDAGFDGVERTLDALDEAGVAHAGSARTAAEARRPALAKANGASVALLSYTYATNGIPLPEGKPWTVNLIDPERVVADARAARKAGADVVLVSLHWGTEWQQQPDEQQLRVARQVTGARTRGRPDVDLVIGTHNHVVQPYEKVNGTWVVYGLGDQVASFTEKTRGNEGSIARFTFSKRPDAAEGRRWAVEKAEFLPQMSEQGPPFRVVDVARGLSEEPGREDYRAVRQRVSEAVLSRGAAEDGLTMAP